MVEREPHRPGVKESNIGQSQRENLGFVQFEQAAPEKAHKDPRHAAAEALETRLQQFETTAENSRRLQERIRAIKDRLYFEDLSSFEMQRELHELEQAHLDAKENPYHTENPSRVAKVLDKIFHWIEG